MLGGFIGEYSSWKTLFWVQGAFGAVMGLLGSFIPETCEFSLRRAFGERSLTIYPQTRPFCFARKPRSSARKLGGCTSPSSTCAWVPSSLLRRS